MRIVNHAKNLFYYFFGFFCLLPVQLNAQGFLRASGEKIVDENGQNVLLRGIGLGGWMLQEGYMLRVNGIGQQQHVIKRNIEELIGIPRTREFYDAWLQNHTTRKDIEALKAWGFNSVRLPMHYNLYTLPVEHEPVKGQHTWLLRGFEITDSLLSWCRDNQLYLILDLHAAPGGQGNDLNIADVDPATPSLWESIENQEKTIALWRKLAERYKDEPWVGAYDIINEPNWGFVDSTDRNGLREPLNAPLKKLMQDITSAIREVDKKHLIIIEGNGWGNNYNGILPPWDSNMAISFHKYWNFNDQASIQQFLDFRQRYQAPIWLGETGENSNVWFTQAISLMERNNIGWCWWPLKKLGINNPIEVPSTEGYDALLKYWAKNGPRPDPGAAYEGLMQLASNTHIDNGVVKLDVVDAMFRQVQSDEALPYSSTTITPGAVLAAVDYDLGRNGVAYFDKDTGNYHISTGKRTAGNSGHVYRNDGVDIKKLPEGDYIVTNIEGGEWLQYTIDVVKAGRYLLELDLIAGDGRGELLVTLPNLSFSQKLRVPARNKEGNKTSSTTAVLLSAGRHQIRIQFIKGGFNFRSIRFVRAS